MSEMTLVVGTRMRTVMGLDDEIVKAAQRGRWASAAIERSYRDIHVVSALEMLVRWMREVE